MSFDSENEADFTAAVPLEISEDTAARTDDLLREFAEDAGLETALVVDRSGALVAGISSEADVTVEVISALVAGASGAMRALVAQLGETGTMESLHLGGNRLIYLKETVHRFVLVAVAEASRPAGLVRQRALAIESQLAEVLREIRPADPPPMPAAPPARSLREIARARAALRDAPVPVPALDEPEPIPELVEEIEDPVEVAFSEEPRVEETFETLDLQTALEVETAPPSEPPPETEESEEVIENIEEVEEVEEVEELEEIEPPVVLEPKGIVEPIDFGEPEIVIEGPAFSLTPFPPHLKLPVDSPFETDDWEDEDNGDDEDLGIHDSDDIFEVVGEDLELPVVVSPEIVPGSLFEIEDDAEGDEDEDDAEGDEDEEIAPPVAAPPPLTSLFEEDDGEDEGEDEEEQDPPPENIFEVDEDDNSEDEEAVPAANSEDQSHDIKEMIADEEEESEIRSSGPFYF